MRLKYLVSRISLYVFYISLVVILDLATSNQEIPSLFNYVPYLEREISIYMYLASQMCVSHNCMLLHTNTILGMKTKKRNTNVQTIKQFNIKMS